MLIFNKKEAIFYERFLQLKSEAGNHSPSIFKLLAEFPEISMKVDACFLCNPYAFNNFYERLTSTELESYVKFYPPQNEEIAEHISKFTNVPVDQILIGNGAIQLIEELMAKFKGCDICINLPTFSTYYEIAEKLSTCHFYSLTRDENFQLDLDNYISWIAEVNPDVVVLVNPNNPTGTLLPKKDVLRVWKSLRKDQILIVDESFIHFAPGEESIETEAIGADNLVIIRSLSKDFGIAGLRLGYSILPTWMREDLLSTGFLWNSNGLAYFFVTLLSDPAFQKQYKRSREKYNQERDIFYKELQTINGVKAYPSSANFFMIETEEDSGILFSKLFYNWGIYSRILNDKAGLHGNFLRIASKDRRENQKIINALKKIYNEQKLG